MLNKVNVNHRKSANFVMFSPIRICSSQNSSSDQLKIRLIILFFLEFFLMLSQTFENNSKIIPINAKPKEIGNGYFKNE
jgi:hypothetical protein